MVNGKMTSLNTKYPDRLKKENKIELLDEYTGSNNKHRMRCMICSYIWTATPKSKIQTLRKNGVSGCPNCNDIKKQDNYDIIRKQNIQKLKDRGIVVLDDWDGRRYLNYNKNPHIKVKVKNVNCGHIFECSPTNLLGAETVCGVCGPIKRAEPIIAWSKTNSKIWQQTATEWEKYRNDVHSLTRQTYNKHIGVINPKNYIRGKAGVSGAYHLDHKVPVRFCFDNNIPIDICAHYTNLQMLEWDVNITAKALLKGMLPPLFLPYVESGERIKKIATELKNELFINAELFVQLDNINITIYDDASRVGIVIIPLDAAYANMQIADLSRNTMLAHNITPFIIFEDELNKNFIVQKLNYYLHKHTTSLTRIHGRQCTIVQIDSKLKSSFLKEFHIQGNDAATISYGAYHNNELLAVMTFAKPKVFMGYKEKDRSKYNETWELSRFATNAEYRIPGIASKLLSVFKNEHKWKKIISYADKRWGDGNLYHKLGFTNEASNKPSYFYIINGVRKHRWNYRKDILKNTLPNYDPTLTEYQNMVNAGFWRLWDCGTIKYTLCSK